MNSRRHTGLTGQAGDSSESVRKLSP